MSQRTQQDAIVVAAPAYANGSPVVTLDNPTGKPPRLLGPNGQPMEDDDGQILVPHVFNFAAIWNYFNQTYSYRYDEALRNSWENALSMRRDLFVIACLDERYCEVTQQPWHVEPYDEKDTAQQETADQLTNLVRAIPQFTGMLRNLEDAVWYGRYGSQFAPGITEVNETPQKTIMRHVPVNGDKIQERWDGTPAIMISPTKRTEYEKRGWKVESGERSPLLYLDRPELRERFAINQYWRDDADYFEGEMAGAVGGVGVRSRIYWFWWMRNEGLGWAMNYLRKVGTLGLMVFPFEDGNPDSEAAAKTNAKQAGVRSTLIVPVARGMDPSQLAPQVIAPNTAGIESLKSFIDSYFERHMERYIVGQNMSDGKDNESGLGGTGRSQFAANTKYQKIKGDSDILAECVTRDILKPIHRWNWNGQRFTYRFVFGVADPRAKDRLDSAKTIIDMGVTLRADDVRAIGGFDKPNPEDETVGGMQAMPGQQESPFGKGLDGQPLKAPPFGEGLDGEPMKQPFNEANESQAYAFVESEHPRASDGRFGDKAGAHSGAKIKGSKQRAFFGDPVAIKKPISKQESGAIGESVVIGYLHSKGLKDARHLNLERNNFPIDLVQDYASIEVKTGLVSNARDAQKWRLTIGEPGKAEKEWLAKASAEEKAAWNERKQEMIIDRKKKALADLSKKLGKKVKARTMTVLLNPDTNIADIYQFEGWHQVIRWNSDEAKSAYVGSVTYG